MDEKCDYGLCDGSGRVQIDEFTDVFCKCFKVKKVKEKLGPDLSAARHILESPLYLGYGTPKITDRTRQNVLIRGTWFDIKPHIRFALFCRYLNAHNFQFVFRLVTDRDLLDIWLGLESYQQRSKRDRDYIKTYNSLKDKIGLDSDLVIIRLNHFGHKNVAAPGVLLEALLLRDTLSKPTWIVEETDKATWRYYLREDVASHISHRFRTIEIEGDGTSPQTAVPEDDGDEEPGFGLTSNPTTTPTEEFPETPAFEAPPVPDSTTEDILDAPGLKDSKQNGHRHGYGKKGRRGNLR